jgi:hypothetical protein
MAIQNIYAFYHDNPQQCFILAARLILFFNLFFFEEHKKDLLNLACPSTRLLFM